LSNIVVTGSGSGLGKEIVKELYSDHEIVGLDTTYQKGESDRFIRCDVSKYGQVETCAQFLYDDNWIPDIIINCAGVNLIGMLEDFNLENWDTVMDVNARSIFVMSKAFLPCLVQSKGTILNIVSNASHMPMTGSAAYNASKGAAHILTLQLARELTRRHGITVFGISPNKLAGTGMSQDIERQVCETRGWTPEYAAKYQKDALLSGEETDPKVLAEFIAYLLQDKQHHKYLTGCVIPYGA
jgi:NAD(P)-dependent dehydrogenase (short-subunit alcohol dehydrogenase family)